MVIRLTFLFLQFVYIVICQWGPPPPPPPPPGFGGPGDFWPMSFEEKMNARNILDTETRSLTFAPPPLKRMLRNYCKQSRIGHPRCGEVFRPRHMGPMDQFHGPPPPPPPPPPPQRRPDYDEEEGWNGQNVNRNQGWESSVPQSQMMQNTNINPSPSSPLPNGFVPPTAPSIPDPPGFSDAVPRDEINHPQSLIQSPKLYDLPNELSSIQQQIDLKYSWGYMEKEVQQTFKKTCNDLGRQGKLNCLNGKTPKHTIKKSNIMAYELATIPGATVKNLGDKYQKTHDVKQSLLTSNNLGNNIVAIEDGTFQDDMLLTNEQSDFLINEIKNKRNNRGKRNAYFIDKMTVNKWPNPSNIPYVFDLGLNSNEKKKIEDALKEIEEGTCLKFVNIPYEKKPLHTYILYKKTPSTSYCGLSYVGKIIPFNPVYLSFSLTCANQIGIIIHETMHTIGVAHQHSRIDRDQFIKIDWSNVNPQFYDMFAMSDPKQFSTYGVSYDYYSIMHYNSYIAAIDDKKPTITPLKQTERFLKILGQRERLSDKDRELVRIMYCSGNCKDSNVYCGYWALKDYCYKTSVKKYMENNCKKSCGYCR